MRELVADHLSFGYQSEDSLLSEICLNIKTGERLTILGENGSGKSTLLRLFAGLLSPTGGRILLDGVSIAERREHVGLLFQNPDHQMLSSTVEEEVALGMELRGINPAVIRQEVENILMRFDLADMRRKPPESLSGGQKQRVALAAIMISRPQFLLLDEPDSFLDARGRHELMKSIENVSTDCAILWAASNRKSLPSAGRHYQLSRGRLEPMLAIKA